MSILKIYINITGAVVDAQTLTFHIRNKCTFPVWPAIAPNYGNPVLADGGFLLQPGQVKQVKAPRKWNGRFWGRTGCNFESGAKPACQTGDCRGLLSCNGSVGLPPATLVEVLAN
jgi:Thaumatin family